MVSDNSRRQCFQVIRIWIHYYDCFAWVWQPQTRCNYCLLLFINLDCINCILFWAHNLRETEKKWLWIESIALWRKVFIFVAEANVNNQKMPKLFFFENMKCNIDYWGVDATKCTENGSRQDKTNKGYEFLEWLAQYKWVRLQNIFDVCSFFLHIWFAFDSFGRDKK